MTDSGIQIIYGDRRDRYHAKLYTNIVYASRPNFDMKMQLIVPELRFDNVKHPLLVYIGPGAWIRPNTFEEIPQLCEFAHKGYVVACVEHRGANKDKMVQDGALFPDAVKDVKEAIRFLRAHAEEYGIDTEHVALLGNATGGHTALMIGLTNGEEEYEYGEYREYSSAVTAVISIHGETDLTTISEDRLAAPKYTAHDFLPGNYPIEMQRLFGDDPANYHTQMAIGSPITYVSAQKDIPPVMLVHDENNHVVPINQSVRMFKALRECGKKVEMYKVVGAGWMHGLWTAELVDTMRRFLDANG